MKNLSTFQIALLGSFAALAVVGVILFALFANSNASSSVGAVEIWGTLDQATFSGVLQQLASNGDTNLSQVTYVQKDPATYQSDLTQALANGTGPDLFLITQSDAIADQYEVQPTSYDSLSTTQFQTLFISAADPFLGQNGVIAVPVMADPLMLYWNKDLFATGGFAQPPQYWDQLFTIASTLSQKDDSGSITQSAIAFGEFDNVNHAKDILATLIMQAHGSITSVDSTTGRMKSELISRSATASESPAETALRFYTEFSNPSKSDYSWNRALPLDQTYFAQGSLGLYVGYASEQGVIKKENPNLNFAVAALPQIHNTTTVVNYSRVYGLALSRVSTNASGAFKVMSDLAGSDNSLALAQAFGMASPRRDVLSGSSEGAQVTVNKEAISSYSWIDPNPSATSQIFEDMIEHTTSGASSPAEAVSQADGAMTQLAQSIKTSTSQ